MEPLSAKVNYFLGRRENWHLDIATYGKVRYAGLYPGIDAVFHAGPAATAPLEFDLIAAPDAKPQDIRLMFAAAKNAAVRILPQGDLRVTAGNQTMLFYKPSAWQEDVSGTRRSVAVAFLRHSDGSIGFRLGTYDHGRSLTIDPVISYSTFLGGTNDEGIFTIKRDFEGNIYVAGETSSADFPAAGAVQNHVAGDYDAFVSKFDRSGTQLIYSTYLGGSAYENANALVLDAHANVYLTGETRSSDFPLVNPLIATQPGNYDGFVTALDRSGSRLIFSTYLGASGTICSSDPFHIDCSPAYTSISAMRIEAAGSVVIAGSTDAKLPVTPGAYLMQCSACAQKQPSGFLAEVLALEALRIDFVFLRELVSLRRGEGAELAHGLRGNLLQGAPNLCHVGVRQTQQAVTRLRVVGDRR